MENINIEKKYVFDFICTSCHSIFQYAPIYDLSHQIYCKNCIEQCEINSENLRRLLNIPQKKKEEKEEEKEDEKEDEEFQNNIECCFNCSNCKQDRCYEKVFIDLSGKAYCVNCKEEGKKNNEQLKKSGFKPPEKFKILCPYKNCSRYATRTIDIENAKIKFNICKYCQHDIYNSERIIEAQDEKIASMKCRQKNESKKEEVQQKKEIVEEKEECDNDKCIYMNTENIWHKIGCYSFCPDCFYAIGRYAAINGI